MLALSSCLFLGDEFNNFDFGLLNFIMKPLSDGFDVDLVSLLVNHGNKFLFGIRYFLESLISGVEI